MDTMKVNPYHISDINVKAVVFSGGIDDYGANPSGRDEIVCIAPYAMKLTKFTIRCETLEAAGGSINVVKSEDGGNFGNAVEMVTTVVPTSATMTIRTNYDMELGATEDITVAAGDMVAIKMGTTAELRGLAYLAVFERI